MNNKTFVSFLFLGIVISFSNISVHAEGAVHVEKSESFLKTSAKKVYKGVVSVLQVIAKDLVCDQLIGNGTESLTRKIISPNSCPALPCIDQNTYSFIFKSYLRDFLHENIPIKLKDPTPFFEMVPLEQHVPIEHCLAQLEKACEIHGIHPTFLAHEFYTYKFVHGYKARLQMASQKTRTLFTILSGLTARIAAEVGIHSNARLSSLFLNPLNNNLIKSLTKVSLSTLLPLSYNNKGKVLWDYSFKASSKTIQRAYQLGRACLFALEAHDIYSFLFDKDLLTQSTLQKLKEGKNIDILEIGTVLAVGFLYAIAFKESFDALAVNITSFKQLRTSDDVPFSQIMQHYSN